MFDVVGLWLNDTWANELVFRNAEFFHDCPFVGVTRVRTFKQHGLWFCCPHNVDDVGNRNVVVVWSWVVAPTQVHAQLFNRNVANGMVQCLDVGANGGAEFFFGLFGICAVATHCQVGAVHLHYSACCGNCFVLKTHGLGNCKDVLFTSLVILVAEK